ncbi:hypothetical protein RHMOL_Rhmol05G0302900 [Rhododendron molle]|uniref:Uncharacterized protein n=1 Tax=Rhododendron molle TaxID=49168 RepID=A0ACC0NV04_RHOML|nr:hypothetical protein RHMOL_Rhmol05G0302900 [Rhododendron molle]
MEIQPLPGHFKLWSELELHEFQHKFVIKAVESTDQGFAIRRSDGTVEPLSGDDVSTNSRKVSTIYGVVGTIRSLAATHVLVITSRKEVGSYVGFPVFRVMSMKFLSCNEALRLPNNQEKRDEAYFRTLLRVIESTPGLYYSYETDITLSLQRRFKLTEGRMSKPIWKQADPRFVWNRNILEELIENKSKVVERHFRDITQRYGETIAVDLTDKHGDEGQLSAAFAAEMQKLPNVRYVSFDFHHYCGKSNLENIQVLYDQVSEDFEKQGYFLMDAEGKILLEQKGVIRSNCIDCLDRTNVTQDAIDLVSGHYTVNINNPSPFQQNGFESFSYLPVASALIIGGLTATSVSLNQAGRNAQTIVSSIICAGVTAGMMALIKTNGRQICSRPRLCGLL